MNRQDIKFQVSESAGDVSGILLVPESSRWLYVLAHGAGAGMNHPFMEAVAEALAEQGVGTFRYQFPYMEEARKRGPNPQRVLLATVRSAVREAHSLAPDLRLVAGGKSMGGRMTSISQSQEPLPFVEGLAFLGFPLHAPGRDSADRGEHLRDVQIPMLFLQGTRDRLANLDFLTPLCRSIGEHAKLHLLESGDHSFKPLKSSGRTHQEVIDDAVNRLVGWLDML